jgi:hypothetical protein
MNKVPIKNYEELYEVSDDGRIYNIKRKKYLANVLSDRYLIVLLYKKNKRKRYYVHRLVAEAFCKKQKGKYFVNHKDLNRLNNNSDNLEWVTSKENRIHFVLSDKYKPRTFTEEQKKELTIKNYKKVLCLETNKVFESMGHFAKYKEVSLAQVSQKLNNKYRNNLNAVLI